ncbi:conserved exported hypothetical protein [Cupriavidus taiwanensis]|uniref:Transcriptional regulator, PaaX family n=1 Tax=Cupriavidus taiwanensis TaxID=164546 RepID=A0A976A8Y4_9BURK|nr:conserved exported hypothetical protein [Cupriavidus taiwanensis]
MQKTATLNLTPKSAAVSAALGSELPPVSAGTLILDLVSTDPGRVYTAAELSLAGTAFGIEATGMRTAMARLKADGRLQQVGRGAYVLGPDSVALQQRLVTWRSVPERREPWRGAWLLAIASARERADRAAWRRTLQALDFDGFKEAEPNLFVRPDNLRGGAEQARARLAELRHAPTLLVASARDLDAARDQRFRRLWQAARMTREHLAMAAALERYTAAVAKLPDAAAAALTLQAGREAVRRIVHDPLLPDELCRIDALQTLIAAMDRFDTLGRAVWRRFLAQAAGADAG